MRIRPVAFIAAAVFVAAGCSKSAAPAADAGKTAAAASASSASPPMAMPGPPASLAGWAQGAQLFDNLGTFHRTVTTAAPDAQTYFDQGMRLMFAFNHDEATRSFAKAAEIDPTCAMCFWGASLTVGPNYNFPVMPEPRAKVAWEALQKAEAQAAHTTPVERALIAALAHRYTGPQPLDPSNSNPVLVSYANAMRDVAHTYADDMDVQVLFAEAMMDTNAWKLWTVDGKPAIGTPEIEQTLERVLAKDPMHPGANHYYIHTMEASPHPEKALASAERLHDMMPGAGHLQHMPAHILQRVGRYEDAAQANRDGAAADAAYMAKTSPIDYYGMYYAHNYQFLAYAASMEGRKAEALDAVQKMRGMIPVDMLLQMPGLDWTLTEAYDVMVRFGDWDALLAEKAPDPRLAALTGGYLYARTLALAATNRAADARAALTALEAHVKSLPPDAGAGLNSAAGIFSVAVPVARAFVARAEGRPADAIPLLREAAAKEDALSYDEPADWFVPVRHHLGALLLAQGRPAEADVVYREDLARHPNNGWALFGLAQALTAEKKTAEAAKVTQQFQEAWKHADVTLTASVF